jgi:RNA polymerase sigma-70 factor (ECF subfamily)
VLVPFGQKSRARTEEFEAVALPHLDDLFRSAVRMVGDRTEAQDLVQEVYLQAWKSFHRFEPGTNCRAWLFKILFHVIQHHRRRWLNAKTAQLEAEMLEETVAYEPPIAEHLRDEDILAAFQKIPGHYREVVLLADVQEFSYKEVAEVLQIPVGTVMSRLSRGRQLLRVELAACAQSYRITQAKERRQGA